MSPNLTYQRNNHAFSCLQIAISCWVMLKFQPFTQSSTALMDSVSLRDSPGHRSCKKAALASSCTGQTQWTRTRLKLIRLWNAKLNSSLKLFFIKRTVSIVHIFNYFSVGMRNICFGRDGKKLAWVLVCRLIQWFTQPLKVELYGKWRAIKYSRY